MATGDFLVRSNGTFAVRSDGTFAIKDNNNNCVGCCPGNCSGCHPPSPRIANVTLTGFAGVYTTTCYCDRVGITGPAIDGVYQISLNTCFGTFISANVFEKLNYPSSGCGGVPTSDPHRLEIAIRKEGWFCGTNRSRWTGDVRLGRSTGECTNKLILFKGVGDCTDGCPGATLQNSSSSDCSSEPPPACSGSVRIYSSGTMQIDLL